MLFLLCTVYTEPAFVKVTPEHNMYPTATCRLSILCLGNLTFAKQPFGIYLHSRK